MNLLLAESRNREQWDAMMQQAWRDVPVVVRLARVSGRSQVVADANRSATVRVASRQRLALTLLSRLASGAVLQCLSLTQDSTRCTTALPADQSPFSWGLDALDA